MAISLISRGAGRAAALGLVAAGGCWEPGRGLYFALPVEPPLWAGWAAMAAGLVAAVLAFRRPWPLALGGGAAAGLRPGQAAGSGGGDAGAGSSRGRPSHRAHRQPGAARRPACGWCWMRCAPARSIRRRAGCGWRCAAIRGFRPGQWLSLTARLDAPPAASPNRARAIWAGRCSSSPSARWALPMARRIRSRRRAPPTLWAAVALGRRGSAPGHDAADPGGAAGQHRRHRRGPDHRRARRHQRGRRRQRLRDAGLAHVLAIAGLHMALVGGGIFWLVRAVLAAIPAIVAALSHQEMGGGGRRWRRRLSIW